MPGRPGPGRMVAAGVGIAAALSLSTAAPAARPASLASPRIEQCMLRAAQHHQVHPAVLRAILRVESGLDPRAMGRNADGSVDIGIGQINSRHLALLASHGIRAEHLLDGCIGAYVAAWHLSRLIATHGNTWTTVARYHSATPSLNRRYQLLLGNELVAAGVLPGARRAGSALPRMAVRAAATVDVPAPPALVIDDPAPAATAP